MIKVIFKNLKNERIGGGDFETTELLNKFVADILATGTLGKPDRWLLETDGNHTNTRQISTNNKLVSDQGVEYYDTITEYFFPAEYTIEYGVDYSNELSDAKKQMDRDIYIEAFKYFGTNDINSMNAFAQSWNLKKDHAEFYVNDGLTATFAFPGFTKGMQLDTATKIRAYYTAMCQTLVAFDKFRDNRIGQYLEEIAAYK